MKTLLYFCIISGLLMFIAYDDTLDRQAIKQADEVLKESSLRCDSLHLLRDSLYHLQKDYQKQIDSLEAVKSKVKIKYEKLDYDYGSIFILRPVY